jgi:hypothetical protein
MSGACNLYLSTRKALTPVHWRPQSSIIARTVDRARDIMDGFTEDEFEQWKAGVRGGLEKNDWIELITHSTYIFDYWMIGLYLITITAKLRKNKKCQMWP